MDTNNMTTLEELAGMKLSNEMRRFFIEMYIKGKEGKLEKINLNK